MPITLPPTRRRFLLSSLALSLSAWLTRWTRAAEPAGETIVLLCDPHINADAATKDRNQTMADNFTRAVGQIAALVPAPIGVIVLGDLAHRTGEPGDYAAFLKLLEPIRQANLPVHLMLGNHDNRKTFFKSLPAYDRREKPVADRHADRLAMKEADLYLLDTLDPADAVKGNVGEAQLAWLTRELDARPDRPALVLMHHPPDARNALPDAEPVLKALAARKQVRLILNGHTHRWQADQAQPPRQHLPSTAYTFANDQPLGWTTLTVTPTEAALKLATLDPNDKRSGRAVKVPLKG